MSTREELCLAICEGVSDEQLAMMVLRPNSLLAALNSIQPLLNANNFLITCVQGIAETDEGPSAIAAKITLMAIGVPFHDPRASQGPSFGSVLPYAGLDLSQVAGAGPGIDGGSGQAVPIG